MKKVALLRMGLLVIGYWLLVVGYWLLVIGCWLLVVGCWLGGGSVEVRFQRWLHKRLLGCF